MRRHILTVLLLLAPGFLLAALAPEFGPGIAAAKGDPRPSMAQLRGKTVIMLFFQEWCPICNKWSGELIEQMQKTYADDRSVVLLGIKTDGDAASGKAYFKGRGDPERWLILGDAEAAYARQVMGDEKLFQFAVVDPAGKVVERGKAGMFQNGKNGAKNFTIARSAFGKRFADQASTLLPSDAAIPANLHRPVLLAEIGCYAEAAQAASRAPKAEADLFRKQLLEGVTGRLDAWSGQLAKTDNADRFLAYLRLRQVAQGLKGAEPARTAAKAIEEANKDKGMRRELDAERAYLAIVAKAGSLPQAQRGEAMKTAHQQFGKAFADTWYGAWVTGLE